MFTFTQPFLAGVTLATEFRKEFQSGLFYSALGRKKMQPFRKVKKKKKDAAAHFKIMFSMLSIIMKENGFILNINSCSSRR